MTIASDVSKTRTQQAFDHLRQSVLEGKFLPGEKLRIDQLGKDVGASIGAIREALARLAAEDLVIATPQRGFVVAPISRKDLSQLTEVRVDVEIRCMLAAMAEGNIAWEGRILSLLHQLSALGPGPEDTKPVMSTEWHRVHEEFHSALTDACPNLWWLRLRQRLFIQSDRYRHYSRRLGTGQRNGAGEHEAIVEAVLARDERAAKERMSEHLWKTTNILLESDLPFSDDV
ncbi:MAG: FCD domain-containing protein [Pseudomonadota bacterium]